MSTLFSHLISPKGLGSHPWLLPPNSPASPVGSPPPLLWLWTWPLTYLIKSTDISSFLALLLLPLSSISLFPSQQRNLINTDLIKAPVACVSHRVKVKGFKMLYKPCIAPTPFSMFFLPSSFYSPVVPSLQPHVAMPVPPLCQMCSHVSLWVLVIS